MSCVTYKEIEQPPVWEKTTTDDIFIKQLYLKHAGSIVPQHSHKYSHTTLLTKGRVKVWVGGLAPGKEGIEYEAPAMIHIPANTKHTFLSLDDDTLLYCIHNVMRQGEVEIAEYHSFTTSTGS